jgi:hyperosmotically inducible periplasmic protein
MRDAIRKFVNNFMLSALLLAMTGASAFAASNTRTSAPNGSAQYEAWLTNQVRRQLVMLPWLSVFDNLEYRVEGNKVVLSGEVVRPVLKDDAANAVKHIEGVESVENDIEVLPLSNFDNQIRRQELRAIYSFPSLQRYGLGTMPSIRIIVKNGHVTLEGAVSDQSDKNAAGIRANGVANVFSVTNNLRVEKS